MTFVKGHKHSAETRRKMSETQKSPEVAEKRYRSRRARQQKLIKPRSFLPVSDTFIDPDFDEVAQ